MSWGVSSYQTFTNAPIYKLNGDACAFGATASARIPKTEIDAFHGDDINILIDDKCGKKYLGYTMTDGVSFPASRAPGVVPHASYSTTGTICSMNLGDLFCQLF